MSYESHAAPGRLRQPLPQCWGRSFIALFPIALMIVNALKTNAEINQFSAELPRADHTVCELLHAWQGRRFRAGPLEQRVVAALTIVWSV